MSSCTNNTCIVSVIYWNKISNALLCCLEKGSTKPGLFSKSGTHELCKHLYWNRNKIIASTPANLLWKERELWWPLVSTLSVEKAVVVDPPAEASPRTDDTQQTPVIEASPYPPVAASAYTTFLGCEHPPSSKQSLPVDSVLCVAHRNEPWFFHGQVLLFPEPMNKRDSV